LKDSDLVNGLRQRDPAAFQCLSERYLPSVWRFVYTRVDGDSHLAEDIVSETVLALVRAVSDESAAAIENPGGWLRSVANHKVQDHYRAVARVRHLIDEAKQTAEPDEQADPAKRQEKQEKRAEIRGAMDELSDQHRTALEWKYLDKLSVREIAERWQTTEKSAESILFRARRDLRMKLMKTDVADELPTKKTAKDNPNQLPRVSQSDAITHADTGSAAAGASQHESVPEEGTVT
jgi:RNA polymerase sigma factor (sigma-70 family)